MVKRDATYVNLTARVTPETQQRLFRFHAERLQRGGRPRHLTASLREVIDAGLAALSQAGLTSNEASHDEREVA